MFKIKKVVIAALAVTALTAAAGTTSASAVTWGLFNTSEASPVLQGGSEGNTVINIQGAALQCTSTLAGMGSATKSQGSMSLSPSIQCPKAFGWIPVTVDTNGCKFSFGATDHSIKLKECTNGGITIKWYVPANVECVISIPNQTETNSHAEYTNTPNNKFLDLHVGHSFNGNVTVSKQWCPFKVAENVPVSFVADYDVYANGGGSEIWWSPPLPF